MNTDELLNIYKRIYEKETKSNFDYCKCDLSKINNLKYKINDELDLRFQPENADEIILYRIKEIKCIYKNTIMDKINLFVPILFSYLSSFICVILTFTIEKKINACQSLFLSISISTIAMFILKDILNTKKEKHYKGVERNNHFYEIKILKDLIKLRNGWNDENLEMALDNIYLEDENKKWFIIIKNTFRSIKDVLCKIFEKIILFIIILFIYYTLIVR